ncbi:growth/differentiation factor 8 [Periplaneta americana]|uniref:growth/differentiation factor 8 n=1 Tax=Periplaneta americana TaxID=6978 RepID=UPI0037E839C5
MAPPRVLVLALLAVIGATAGLVHTRHRHSHLLTAWKSLSDLSSDTHEARCPGCGARRYNQESQLAEQQLTALRIEMIKEQILKKLRLKERPSVSMPLSALPKPLTSGVILNQSTNQETNRDVDDFYGTTDKVILFPQEDGMRCSPAAMNHSACFGFKLPAELQAEDVTSVELWLYKEEDLGDNYYNQSFVVSEVVHGNSNHSIHKTKQLASYETGLKAGWMKIDLLWTVKIWLEYQELTHAINVECKTCIMDVNKSPVALESEHKPFIIISTKTVKKNRRAKRSINCHPGVSECCRENLYISFADIGWDEWILQPTGYHAYFCRGSCNSAASITQSGAHHSTLMQRLLLLHSNQARQLDLVPCCAPTKLSSLQLLYVDNNQTITHATLPNMVVESCGCM